VTTPLDSRLPDKANTAPPPLDQGASRVSAQANENLQAELASVTGLTKGISSKPISVDTHAPAKAQQYNQDGFIGSLVENLEYQGIQQTTKALAQIGDQVAGTNMADHVHLFNKPLSAEYKSSEWYGEQFGSAAGQLAPFVAAFAITRGASAKLGLKAALAGTAEEGLLLSRNNLILTGQTAVAGFASSAVFTPNEGAKKNFTSFAVERLKNGAIGGLDMAAITAGTLSLKTLGTAVAKDSPLIGAALRNTAVGAALTGYPTGALSAQLHAGLFEGRTATLEECQQSALGMAAVGFGLGSFHGKVTEGAVDRVNNPTITDVLKGNAERGYQHFDNFMASINPLLANEPRLAYAQAGGRAPLRSLAMQATLGDLSSTMMMQRADEAPTNSGGRSGGRNSAGSDGPLAKTTKAATAGMEKGEVTAPGAKPEHQPLHQALRDLNLSEVADFVAHDKVLKNQKVIGALGAGFGNDSPAVLELAPSKAFPEGGALKVTIAEGGWQNNWGHRAFDAQLLSKVHEVDLAGSNFAGSANVYVQEIVDTAPRYDQPLVDGLFAKIADAGLVFGDQGSDIMKQVGISRKNGDLVLIDYPSVDTEGTHETLNQITEGHQRIEEEWEKENTAIRSGKTEKDTPDFEQVLDAEKLAKSQSALKEGSFTEREQELLQQLKEGIPPKEVLEFAALLDGKIKANGMPDIKAAKPGFDALVRRAQKAGVLDKGGKQAKMGGSSDDSYDQSDY
jgi:hypothetical protein